MNNFDARKERLIGIGTMSGTSMDGLDIAVIELNTTRTKFKWKLLDNHFVPYSQAIFNRVKTAHTLSIEPYFQEHVLLGKWMGQELHNYIVSLAYSIDFIASHGQTIIHRPQNGFTVQMGHGAYIAAETGVITISDLRSMDMAYGGQGAPMVPIGETTLFPEYAMFLNIGGIANISIHSEENTIGFDICGANIVLNQLCRSIGKPYDHNGEIASSGSIIQPLLDELNHVLYYSLPIPKSLDKEENLGVIQDIISKYKSHSVAHLICTYTEHIAQKIGDNIEQYKQDHSKVLITGGGAHNAHLMNRIKSYTDVEVVIPSKEIIDNKEAIVMAYFGLLRIQNQANFIKEVTGAAINSISGAVYCGANNKL